MEFELLLGSFQVSGQVADGYGAWHFERCKLGNEGLRTPESGQFCAAKGNNLLLSSFLLSLSNSHNSLIMFPKAVDCFVQKDGFFCNTATLAISSQD